MNKYLILAGLLLFCSIDLSGQVVKISSFGFENPTDAFVRAMNSHHDSLLVENMGEPWKLGPMRFYKIRNKVILFEEGAELKALPGAFPKTTDALFKFIDCENISLLGAGNTIAMNKAEYTDGEWRHVIRLRGCTNVTIENLTLRDSGGDAITIGRSNAKSFSENIMIKNIQALNNKRQGISIVSAKKVTVLNSIFADTEGTLPGAGVDIEPDLARERIQEIVFKNCIFKNNYHAGVKLALGKLTSSSEPVDVQFIDCLISNNFSPDNPKPPAEIFIRSHKLDPVKGRVLFKNCLVENSKWGLLYAQKNAAGFQVDFEDCTAKNICQGKPRPAIYLEVPHYRESTEVGGYSFSNLFLDYEIQAPVIAVQGSRRGTLKHLRDLNGTISLRDTKVSDFEYINYNRNNNLNVDLKFVQKKTD